MKKPKILLAMSGGVDSSVAALKLQKKGYDVHGAFMKNYSDTKNKITGECAWVEERNHAIKIATKLNIPFITLDFEKEYKKFVVDEMFKKYKQGITPNPDIDCNQKIKFPMFIKEAEKRGINLIATGHYARIKTRLSKKKKITDNFKKNFRDYSGGRDVNPQFGEEIKSLKKRKISNKKILGFTNIIGNSKKNRVGSQSKTELVVGMKNPKYIYELHRAKDEKKDQSYFLYRQTQDDLAKTLFPIGELTKTKVRAIAKKKKFPNFNKKGTVGICFIGKVNMKDFLQKKIKPKKGKILSPEREIIGQHDGIYYYTIGQRLGPKYGFEIKRDKKTGRLLRWYVARKDPKKNTIIAAPEGHPLNYRQEITIKDLHLIDEDKKIFKKQIKKKPRKVLARIRQAGELLKAKVMLQNNKVKVILNKPITGVSQGQAIVLYDKTKVLGGGEISF